MIGFPIISNEKRRPDMPDQDAILLSKEKILG
jgi:hypothetical protein